MLKKKVFKKLDFVFFFLHKVTFSQCHQIVFNVFLHDIIELKVVTKHMHMTANTV